MSEYLLFLSNHPYLVGAFCITLMMLLYLESQRLRFRGKSLSPLQATHMFNKDGALFIDTRERNEFEKKHIQGARNIPLPQIKQQQLASLKQRPAGPLILYCHSGQQAVKACALLQRQGFVDCLFLNGGLMAWEKAELPTISGRK